MRPMVITQAGTGSSAGIPVNWYGPGSIGLQVEWTGTGNWTIQQAIGTSFAEPPTGEYINSADTNLVSQTQQRQGNISNPCTHVRVVVAGGTGTAQLRVLQAGLTGT